MTITMSRLVRAQPNCRFVLDKILPNFLHDTQFWITQSICNNYIFNYYDCQAIITINRIQNKS